MRHGVVILPDESWRRGVDRWVRAEQLGFEHAWTFDHLLWRELRTCDWFSAIPFASQRMPQREELGGGIGAFAHVLHVSWLSFWASDAMDAHRRLRPKHLDAALAVVRDEHLATIAREGGDVCDAIDALWPSLRELIADV